MLTEHPFTPRRTTTFEGHHVDRCSCKSQGDGGFTCTRIYEDRGGVCTSLYFYISTLTPFKRDGCLPGVPIEARCVLNRFLHNVLLKLSRCIGNSRQTERSRSPVRDPSGGTARCSKHGYPFGRAIPGSLCGSQGRPAVAEELCGRRYSRATG